MQTAYAYQVHVGLTLEIDNLKPLHMKNRNPRTVEKRPDKFLAAVLILIIIVFVACLRALSDETAIPQHAMTAQAQGNTAFVE